MAKTMTMTMNDGANTALIWKHADPYKFPVIVSGNNAFPVHVLAFIITTSSLHCVYSSLLAS